MPMSVGCSLETLQEIRLKMVEKSPDAKFAVAPNHEIVDCNEQAELIFGYHRSKMIGGPVENLVPEEFRDAHVSFVDGFFANPRKRQMGATKDIRGRHASGKTFSVLIELSPIVVTTGVFAMAVARPVP